MSPSFEQAMARFAPALPLAVAFSGGADSTALLAACAERWPLDVVALHVHHGLQDAADDFERHCDALCRRLDVPLRSMRVDARHAPGESPEEAARRARWDALFSLAAADADRPALSGTGQGAIRSLALAQHADDQVETLLLALSRGAGLRGLAAMPAQAWRSGLMIHRPLLEVPASELRAWLIRRDIAWIEDPSNADVRYTRNRIRRDVLPALAQAFPHFRATFARSAAHAAEAQGLLDELAAADLASIGMPPRIAGLQALTEPRAANALRHWLAHEHGCMPSTAQLAALQRQISDCTTRGKGIALKVGSGWLQREAEQLRWYNAPPSGQPER